MRETVYTRVAAFALIFGTAAGIISAFSAELTTIEAYGTWFVSFYNGSEYEIWIKAIFSNTLFVTAAFLTGLFILGYLFIYPVCFYWGYTFGFLVICAIKCFGVSVLDDIAFRVPSMFFSCWLLCKTSGIAVRFSSDAFSGLDFFELRKKTSVYLSKGLFYIILSAFATVYEAILTPKILNLWDSF